jgi:hypothetical protein
MSPLAMTAVLGLVLLTDAGAASQPVPGGPGAAPPTLVRPPPATCDAPQLTYLIGRPKTEIPVPVDPSRRRVSCTTCPVSQDYRPERTDILFDEKTGLVTAVKCG